MSRRSMWFGVVTLLAPLLLVLPHAQAGVGDPQIGTDHPWYSGELSCSTFERLFATQQAVYKRVTGRDCSSDEDRVLASWLWRNTHYFHAEEGTQDLWGKGFTGKVGDMRNREYWTGLFSHGYGLCGTTHSQYCAEMEALLGHGRGRGMGVDGHNTFEVFLKGGPYGEGKWALLDHDQSTVVFDSKGTRLLGMKEIVADWKKLTDRKFEPRRQRGWLPCGLHPSDATTYAKYATAEYLAGYAGPPPMVHLRRGESLRRYFAPGLEDGKTFAYWGLNYNAGGIPGPERSLTWVNDPDAMFKSKTGATSRQGRARYGNAVFTYRPDFSTGDYREGLSSEDQDSVTFAFQSPYVIAATPANAKAAWGIYARGAKNGLVVRGKSDCKVYVSVDHGKTWHGGNKLSDNPDLTDFVKGHRRYRLELRAPAKSLVKSDLSITTVCEASAAVMPHLKEGGSVVRFEASGKAVESVHTLPQASAHVIAGKFDSPRVTLQKATLGEPAVEVFAAAHIFSGNPPDAKVRYQIEASFDEGKTWRPVVKDWTINRQGDEPKDFWSQSMCWGRLEDTTGAKFVRVRFSNNGGKRYARAEIHLVYKLPRQDATKVTYAWSEEAGERTAGHTFTGQKGEKAWAVLTGKNVRTKWVEFTAAPR